MSSDDRTVELVRLTDAVEAEMLRDFIRDEGLFCATPGMNHRAALGMAGGYVDIVVRVRQSELDEARALLEAFRGGEVVEGEGDEALDDDEEGFDDDEQEADEDFDDDEDDDEDDDDDDDDDDAPAGPPTSPRLKRVAAFCSLALTFGCGHFYARRYPQGFALLAASLGLLAIAIFGRMSLFLVLYPLVMLADLAGSFVAVDEFNGVEREDSWAKWATALPYVMVCLTLAGPALFGIAPRLFLTGAAETVCEANLRCQTHPMQLCEERMQQSLVRGEYDRRQTASCAECVEAAGADCAAVSRCHNFCSYWITRRTHRPSRELPSDGRIHLDDFRY